MLTALIRGRVLGMIRVSEVAALVGWQRKIG